jgi:superfamily II DNA or RNA helicase
MAPYVDIEVEPLSDVSLHHLGCIRGVQFPGDELLARIEYTVTIRGKRGRESLPPRDDAPAPEGTRMVMVIHHDGRDIPTIYGIPYTPDIQTFSESLAAVVPLAPNERFLFGWYHMGLQPGYIGGFISDRHVVPRADERHYVFTAWRTVVSEAYVAVDCVWNQYLIAPHVLLPFSVNDGPVGGATTYQAFRPFIPSAAAYDRCSIFANPLNGSSTHPDHYIHRVTIILDRNAPEMSTHPRVFPHARHDSASPLTLVHEWRDFGRRSYERHCREDASVDGVRKTLINSPTYTFAFTVHAIDRTTLRITSQVPSHSTRGQLRLLPVHACPNRERWYMAMEMAKHHRDIRGTFDFITSVLQMDDDAPLARQPSTLRVPLQRHQLQNLAKMIENERTTFRALMYTAIPSSSDSHDYSHDSHDSQDKDVLYIDPKTNEIANHRITVSTHSCGGFLCDDMGLGKTLSVIALCVSNPPDPIIGCGATLVVCPPSIIGQWAREIASYAPSLVTLVYHGKKKDEVTTDAIVGADIVLTTYTTYMQHTDFLFPIHWGRVVFDESHTMSDRFATNAPNAPRRWCITATPFNSIYRQFRALHMHVRPFDFGVGTMYYALEPIMIRHAKEQTDIALPPLTETMVPIDFATAAETSLYAAALERVVKELDATPKTLQTVKLNAYTHVLRAVCTGGTWDLASLFRGHASSLPTDRRPDFSLVAPHGEEDMCPICMNDYDQPTMTTCNHWFCSDCIATALIRTGAKCPMCRRPQQESQLRLGVLDGAEETDVTPATTSGAAVPCASKQTKLLELLRSIEAADPTSKSLVFCHTSTAIPEIMRFLKASGFKCRSIHGGMPALQRGNAIRAFQTDPKTSVFVLSIRSAAAGINLTAANHVIFTGPCMNRAGHHQAIGRAHRFGQHRPVTVHHMYVRGTIEDGLHRAFERPGAWSGDVWDQVVRHTILR